MEAKDPVDYSHYIENENEALPATAIHRHAQAGYNTTAPGEKLVPGITIDFDLSDPFFTEYKPGEYKPLHDPHLKNFLKKKSVRRCLMKNNLITKDGEVRCTLQEFNRFQRNLKHYFKTQKRIARALEKKKFYVDPKKVIRNKLKNSLLQKKIQHNVKIAEAKARHTESMMKRRKQILNVIVKKDRQMAELIQKVRIEREDVAGQALMERKRRELLKIRLDSCELVRRCTILQRVRQRERIVAQKSLLEKQRRLKKFTKENLEWHKERMNAKDEEMIKFLDENDEKQAKRKQSILARTIESEEIKNIVTDLQKNIFDNHMRTEDMRLEEARAWQKKVEDNRVKAANSWRAKMHCMQTIATGRMADIERRKFERKRNSMARKKAQIEENLDHLEKMNVTVLGTTGCGTPELANIHRDQSKIRFSAYCEPGKESIDPCRTTQFHAFFKPLHVMHAKYQPGMAPRPPPKRSPPTKVTAARVHRLPKVKSCRSSNISNSSDKLAEDLLNDLLSEMISSELDDIVTKTQLQEEDASESLVNDLIDSLLGDVIKDEATRISQSIVNEVVDTAYNKFNYNSASQMQKNLDDLENQNGSGSNVMVRMVHSTFSLFSDAPNTACSDQPDITPWSRNASNSYTTVITNDFSNLVEDVVKKIMDCFEGNHEIVYKGQTSVTTSSTRDGEEIITDIITRLITTVNQFTKSDLADGTISESTELLLSPNMNSSSPRRRPSTSRDSLKDLHKRAQFLLNHALDVAKVKLKLKGYAYLTWNILEDCLIKAKEKILAENTDRVAHFTDVELVEWVMEDAKVFLSAATTLLYETMHELGGKQSPGGNASPENRQIVEECYLDQLEKSYLDDAATIFDDSLLEDCIQRGDMAKFSVLLVRKTLLTAMMTIPKKTSMVLSGALRDGEFDLAGSILAAKSIKVAHKELILDPQTTSQVSLKEAMQSGNVEEAGTHIANIAIQKAMDIQQPGSSAEQKISSMVLRQALEIDDLNQVGDVLIEKALQEALDYLNSAEPSLEESLKFGDLEVAGKIMAESALKDGLKMLLSEEGEVRRDSSIVLNTALATGNLPTAATVMAGRALLQGMTELVTEPTLRRDSSIALETALESGDLPTAGNIIADRLLKSGMTELEEASALEVLNSPSSVVLEQSLHVGDLERAAPILVQRALVSALHDFADDKEEEVKCVTIEDSSELLEHGLKSGYLEQAGEVLVNRAIRSGVQEVVEDADEENKVSEQISANTNIPIVHSFEDLEVEQITPLLVDGIYFLETEDQSANGDQQYARGELFVKDAMQKVYKGLEVLFDGDVENCYGLLGLVIRDNDFVETSKTLAKVLLEAVRFEVLNHVEQTSNRTKYALLSTLYIFETCIEILRGAPGPEDMQICTLIIDHLRNTMEFLNITIGVDATIGIILSKCLTVVKRITIKPKESKLKLRHESSVELLEACRNGNAVEAGSLLTQKILRRAEKEVADLENDVRTFKSASDILNEKTTDLPERLSTVSVRSTKSKRKINTEGLPMPKHLSQTSRPSVTSSTSSSSNYEPIRQMLLSEERELMVSNIVSNSEKNPKSKQKGISNTELLKKRSSIGKKSDTDLKKISSVERLAERLASGSSGRREVGDVFTERKSDLSLPLIGESNSNTPVNTQGYVRKVQSKGHVYYINEEGVIKKKAKKKRGSNSKRRLSQEDLPIKQVVVEQDSIDEQNPSEATSDLQMSSSESDQMNIKPSYSRNKRSNFKRKESSLQMMAVINSSYTNMLSKQSSDQPLQHALSSSPAESDLMIQPKPPTGVPSSSSRKSAELHKRNSFKKKESSLQLLAVINSSYTNMLGKRSSASESDAGSLEGPKRKVIDEMLTETDKALIKKLSIESTSD